MNKKVLTLCAGFLLAGLLAGGMFSTVDASLADMVPGQYYRIALAANGGSHSASQYYLDSDSHPSTPWYVAAADLDNDGSSWWTVEQVKDPVTGAPVAYKLVNKKGVYYTVKDASDPNNVKEYDAFIQKSTNSVNLSPSGVYWSLLTYDGNLTSSEGSINSTTYWGADNEKITPQALSIEKLNAILGTSFGLQICYQPLKDNNTAVDTDKDPVEYADLQGNPFTGSLVAANGGASDVSASIANAVAIYQGTTNKIGKRVVLTKATWGSQGGGTTQVGYKFATYTDKEYAANKNNIIADRFVVTQPAVVAGAPLEVSTEINGDKYELVVTIIENEAGTGNVYRLTMAKSYDSNNEAVADYTFGGAAATSTSTVQNTYVQFGITNMVDYSDFYGKLWNIYKDGKVATPSCTVSEYYGNSDNSDSWIPVAQVAANYPEGQWLFDATKDLDNDGVKEGAFVNRESGHVLSIPNLRYVEGKENTYTKGDATYTISPAGTPSDNYNDGYLAGYTTDQLKQKAFFIGTPIAATQDTVWLSKAANGKLEFVEDKADAVEFRLTMDDFDNDANKSFQTAKTITSYTIWDNQSAGETKNVNDVVNYHQYRVSEAVSGDVLYYDETNKRFALANIVDINFNWYNPIVIKNKGTDVYNLLFNDNEFAQSNGKSGADELYETKDYAFCSASKIYGAQNVAELVKADGAYEFTQNDIFVVVDADAQMYRGDFSNTGVLDTIKIFRNDDNSYVLYEKGALLTAKDGKTAIEGFLGMENINDPKYADMHAAMLADTAFYSNTFRPQYMLAVDAEIVNDGWTCPLNPEHNTQAWREENGGHCADAVKDRPYIQGRYLVNLVDSAVAATNAGVKFADNKFVHEYYNTQATPYYRLGFVQAKHIGDSLIIASTNDTINLKNNPEDQVCTFAFRYVDAERDAFTIETLYRAYDIDEDGDIDRTVRGYIKYQNGIPVVTPKASEAWVFDLNETSETPTANETIESAADATISVVAVDGAVIIKGAEGKNVIVSTILGKVVANEVLNSDNETIAAPAGIVVVSVDGESFKVAVK